MTGLATPPLLLTGAGFMRDFGGFLADEMLALVQTAIRRDPRLFAKLKSTLDYEQLYGEVVIQKAGSPEEADTLIAALQRAYGRMDDSVRRVSGSPRVSNYHLRQFIGRFSGRTPRQHGYFFTLNQDLFVERHLGPICLHGQVRVPPDLHNNPDRKLNESDYVTLRARTAEEYRAADVESGNPLHYVKLHGSMNWRSNIHPNAMVIGHVKEDVIAREPVLAYYLGTFEQELYQPGRRLCVIGYGFRDPHINQRIANALEQQKKCARLVS